MSLKVWSPQQIQDTGLLWYLNYALHELGLSLALVEDEEGGREDELRIIQTTWKGFPPGVVAKKTKQFQQAFGRTPAHGLTLAQALLASDLTTPGSTLSPDLSLSPDIQEVLGECEDSFTMLARLTNWGPDSPEAEAFGKHLQMLDVAQAVRAYKRAVLECLEVPEEALGEVAPPKERG
jgi:hypothetical protein